MSYIIADILLKFNPVTFYWSTWTKQEGSFICVLGISNLHISTIFLLNVGTVPTVWYTCFRFIIGYEKKNQLSCNWEKKIWLWSSSVIKIVEMKYNQIDIKWWLVSTSLWFRKYLKILSYFCITFTILFHLNVHFFPVLVKGLYQTESYSLHVMQLICI